MKTRPPTSAFIAVTLNCNSRCLMCDIWKKAEKGFINQKVLRELPFSLKSIDITGGEPFLHPDLSAIVKTIHKTCPHARLLITTNGLIPEQIKQVAPLLLRIDKNMSFRVSLDGAGKIHDRIRGIKGAYNRVVKTLEVFRELKVKDLGIIFTLSKINNHHLIDILDYCKNEKLSFSLNLIHESPIYFGKNNKSLKLSLEDTQKNLKSVTDFFRKSPSPKNFAKTWFYKNLSDYAATGKRKIVCGAGENFFYLNPEGDIYMCHLKDWLIGNLNSQSFNKIWNSRLKPRYMKLAQNCNSCFMICTVRDELKRRPFLLLK